MKMLRKIINSGSLKNLKESLYDRVDFSKVTSLQCTDFITDSFQNMFQKLAA